MRLTIKRVRALAEAATPGPWTSERAIYSTDHLVTMDRRSEAYVTRETDAALIAAAPDLASDLLDAHAALATERERAEAAERALATLRTAVSDAAKAMSRGSQEALVRVMHASPAESGQRLARAAAYDYAETLMRAALAGCP